MSMTIMGARAWCAVAPDRSGQAESERLRRIVRRSSARWVPQLNLVSQPAARPHRDRMLAPGIQRGATAEGAGWDDTRRLCETVKVTSDSQPSRYSKREDVAGTVDRLTPLARSQLMSRIRSKNTKPEVAVRSALHRLGFRFRLHRKGLPGQPDIVLPRHRKIILVQGCFWHGHTCRFASKPKSNEGYWERKIRANQARDVRNLAALVDLGWSVLELWECEIKNSQELELRLRKFLGEQE